MQLPQAAGVAQDIFLSALSQSCILVVAMLKICRSNDKACVNGHHLHYASADWRFVSLLLRSPPRCRRWQRLLSQMM